VRRIAVLTLAAEETARLRQAVQRDLAVAQCLGPAGETDLEHADAGQLALRHLQDQPFAARVAALGVI
jgi:hypothetical protein